MSATTRSATKPSRIENFADKDKIEQEGTTNKSLSKPQKKPSLKRKSPSGKQSSKANAYKKLKPDVEGTKHEDPIIINRAPVLQLWGAAVAQFVHPDLSWLACLSIGNSISTICAISRGRSIGVFEPKDEPDESKHKPKKLAGNILELAVMGFPMQVKGNAIISKGTPKLANENSIKGKFGSDEKYEATRAAFQEALNSWKGSEQELENKAFHMYERFRPNVSGGQQGWGRKGRLDLNVVHKIVHK